MRSLFVISCLLLSAGAAFLPGQSVPFGIVKSTVILPPGQLFGVALSSNGSTLIAEQTERTPTGRDGSASWTRSIVSVSTNPTLVTNNRTIDELARGQNSPPCGQIRFLQHEHIVIICSSNNALEELDATNLSTRRVITLKDPGVIGDFDVLESSKLALILRFDGEHSVWLDKYNLADGSKLDSILLSALAKEPLHLAVDSETQYAYASFKPTKAKGDEEALSICQYASQVQCKYLEGLPPIAQMDILGRQLLFVTSRFAGLRKDCIMSILPNDLKVRDAYCAPKTGVHYAFAAVQNYIVGFTGTAKYQAWSERTKPTSESISIWTPEIRDPVSQVGFSASSGFQNGIRFARAEIPVFAAYELTGNFTEIYRVQGTK